MYDQALAYLERKVSVIPVGRNKVPLIAWKEYQERLATQAEVLNWFTKYPDAQLGLVTGKISSVIVVDVEKGGDPSFLPQETTIIKTGGGGWHYYYQYHEFRNKARIRPLVDIRGDGGYVIIPPSVSDKGAYEVIQTLRYPKFPAHLFEEGVTQAPELKGERQSHDESFDVLDYPGYGSGQRNHRMAEYAGRVLARLHPDIWDTVGFKLYEAANRRNNPPLDERELKHTFRSIMGREASQLGAGDAKRFHQKHPGVVDPASFRVTSTHELMTMELPKFPYVVDRLIPKRAITAITADSGKGKSMLAWILCTYIAKGEKVFGEFGTEKQKIMIIDQEMDRDLIADRYRSVAKEELPIEFMIEQSWSLTDESHYQWLVNHIRVGGIQLVIFDTLTTIHDKEENSSSEMREVNKQMLRLIADTNITLIYLHHHRKPMPGVALSQSSSRGSTEIIAKVASHLLLDQVKKEVFDMGGEEMGDNKPKRIVKTFLLSQEKARRPESIDRVKFEVAYDELTHQTSWKFLGDDDGLTESVQKAYDGILEYFSTDLMAGKCTTQYLVEKVQKKDENISRDSITRALKELVTRKRLVVEKDRANRNANMYSIASVTDVVF